MINEKIIITARHLVGKHLKNRDSITGRTFTDAKGLKYEVIQGKRGGLYYHECEPMAAAERIDDYLGVNYECIFELIN